MTKIFAAPREVQDALLGPFEIKSVTYGGVVKLQYLAGKDIQGLVNGIRLKLYRDS
jgi:hypothetical protein